LENGSTTASNERIEKVLDFFGQVFDIFLTMTASAENKGFIYEFGKFVLDPQERVLLADGQPVHLSDKVFDTLLFLIENNGRLLSKEEMMTSIWEESFVEESNLAKNISRLRKILHADGARLIETLPKHGYRFLANVRQIDGATDLLVHRRLRVTITNTAENGDRAEKRSISTSLDEIHSLAVLPFQLLGLKAEDDFFGIGITDALITQLSRAGGVPVRQTSSILKYDILELDAVAAGRELQVDAVLEGKLQRLDNKLRLTVQMLQTASGAALWADSFNAEIEDIFAVQDQIAARVVGALTKKLGGDAGTRPTKHDTENVEAYKEYLKGRFYWNKRTVENYDRALECYRRAIELDPLYALAYAGLADIYNLLPLYNGFPPNDYYPKAKAAALKALAIDKNLAEAHVALGMAILHCDWNFSGAEVSYRQAIKLNPNYGSAYQLLGSLLCRVERISEAVIVLKKAQELDPLAPINAVWLAEALRYGGETEASIGLHLETLKSFPEFFPAHYHLAFSYLDAGLLDEAERHGAKAVSLSHETSLTISLQGILQAARGDRREVEKTLQKLLRIKAEKYISGANIATVYAAAGEYSEAMDWLEMALIERDPYLTWLKFDKEFKCLHGNPRFEKILEKIGLSDVKVEPPPETPRRAHWKLPVLASGASLILLISALGFYFWKREKPVPTVNPEETGALRLTDNPNDDSHPRWTTDGRIRFFRTAANRFTESWIMNADGTNQTVVKDSPNMQFGVWSPDGQKVIFAKPNDKTAYYLANSDGSNEVALPFYSGNFDWSFDSKQIVYQKTVESNNVEIFLYALETKENRNLTKSEKFDADPSFSPDGREVAFVSNRDGNGEVYVLSLEDESVRRLTAHPGVDSHPVFSPDGTQIAFTSDRGNESADIFLVNADGSGNVLPLTNWVTNETLEPGGWSPDGTKIAFFSDRNGKDDIYVVSAEVLRPQAILADREKNLRFPAYSPDGKQISYQAEAEDKSGELLFDAETKKNRLVAKTERADNLTSWSPDGSRLAFQNYIDGNTEICLINPDGSGLKNLTNNASRDVSPAFSPDGRQIIFSTNRDGTSDIFQLYLMNTDGSDQRRIYYSPGISTAPVFSPDGRQIVFANDNIDARTGNFELFSIETENPAVAKRLTFRRRFDTFPAFSPDGRHLAFVSEMDGNLEIYLMNSDGTGVFRVTRDPAEDIGPQFSRDGKKIIFSSNRQGKFAIYEVKVFD
jgi:Tol biopolymer transport system component/TolB-like protein/Flp pilus assembly protein TadD